MALVNFFLLLYHFLYFREAPKYFPFSPASAPLLFYFILCFQNPWLSLFSFVIVVLVSVVNILCLFILSFNNGYIGVWIALAIFMSLCVFVSLLR
ncbi:hypothetical protein E1A91_A03G144000v1 [Gossypium mustelinum]|uniref:Uncharacterized protein n=1 Tax=Gossypium mustelinum TaxID=34275 RepID=A0A5D3A0U9_GOSMU|nr:hypothetical protein E1A91_A03G144000v1 [Gossypium mustelinum]